MASHLLRPRHLHIALIQRAGQARSMTKSSVQVSQPVQAVQVPTYYQTTPPPHHKPNGAGFQSPWKSANPSNGGLMKFLKARLFDWNEVPLSKDNLPDVSHCTWKPSGQAASADDILFTWVGHAGCHIRMPLRSSTESASPAYLSILTDPVFSKRCSPSQSIGPERFTEAPTSIVSMAESKEANVWPDLLVLSHNHYDHLDYDTVKAILQPPSTTPPKSPPHIICPLGLATFFQSMGVDKENITELDWWQSRQLTFPSNSASVQVTCVPAQHFSGRFLNDRDRTLWAGFTFECEGKKFYFAGDSGYRTVARNMTREQEEALPHCPAFKEIGDTLGPFDLSAIPIGAYLPRGFMSTIHMAPRDSVQVHREVKSRKSIGIHWGAFRLTPEDVNEPPRQLAEEAKSIGLKDDEFIVMGNGETRAFPTAANSTAASS